MNSITVTHHADFEGKNAHTILAWVKPAAALSTGANIVKKFSSGNVGYKFTGGTGGTLLYTLDNGGGAGTLQSPTALSTDTWYHVGATLNGMMDTMRIYVNGEIDTLQSGTFNSAFSANTDALVIGKGYNGVIRS